MTDSLREGKRWASWVWDALGVATTVYLIGWLVADALVDSEALSDGEWVVWFTVVLLAAGVIGARVAVWWMRRASSPARPEVDTELLMAEVEKTKTANAAIVGIGTEMRSALEGAGFSPTAAEQIAMMAMARMYENPS